jgi:two-component sensor histidine kinase/DNA-binding response OmpR family regulator
MRNNQKANILLVDDQPAKLLSYEVMLAELGEHLIKASSAREALEQLLKTDVAVILVDVCMPEQDGFELAAMIREHPRFQKTAIIFISAIHLAEGDHLRGYEMGAVDYMPVPVIPQVLRAKVKVFVELYRKTKELELLNLELEERVARRTAELRGSNARLLASEERRNMALSAGHMGSWDWDSSTNQCNLDLGQCEIMGLDPWARIFPVDAVRARIHPEDWQRLIAGSPSFTPSSRAQSAEFRVIRPDGELRWCIGTAAASFDEAGGLARVSGVTADITERKRIEEHRVLLAREVDHRAKNSLAVVQSIVRLTRAKTIKGYIAAVEGRIHALSKVHSILARSRWQGAEIHELVSEELAAYQAPDGGRMEASGPRLMIAAPVAQSLALALHELATNAAKYGALSMPAGRVALMWEADDEAGLVLRWEETGGPPVATPVRKGLGLQMIAASLKGHLGGEASFEWHAEGLRCTLSLPGVGAGATGAAAGNVAAAPLSAGRRILLVEDEALVGMMAGNLLSELGYVVVGPCTSVGDALAVIGQQHIDAAVLDINLNGQPVHPVADVLAHLNIPFAFVTGYGRDSIEPRFAHVPILEKPVVLEQLRDLVQALSARAAPCNDAPVPLRA